MESGAAVQIDPEKRKLLIERRRQLQEELDKQARRDTIADVLGLLDQRGMPYELIYETDPYYAWIDRHFIVEGGNGHVDWGAVQVRSYLSPETSDEASSWLVQLADTVPESGGDVVMLWLNGNSPAVRVKFTDLAGCPDAIASDFETWVISERGGWLIEYVCDNGWSFGLAGN